VDSTQYVKQFRYNFCTTGIAGYRRVHTLPEIYFSYTVNNVTD